MQVTTTHFGIVNVAADAVITFAEGLVGLEHCQRWVLLPDTSHDAVAWLQSLDQPDLALAVVSPRRFVPNYQLRAARRELSPLKLARAADAEVLAIVSRNERGLTINLKAPLVINLRAGVARQVVTNGDQPVQYDLPTSMGRMKSAA
jgi:flagellar assembly factor FliW